MKIKWMMLFVGCVLSGIGAAPMPPFSPVTVEGEVLEVVWTPQTLLKGEPGMSGTLGGDLIQPARYTVVLRPKRVVIDGEGDWSPFRKDQERVTLYLEHAEDDGTLSVGQTIRVSRYVLRGDEGGVWTRYEALEVLSRPGDES